jgi:hypothetical protein
METIRKVGIFELRYEPLQRMYQVGDDKDISFWFDSHTKDELMALSDDDFVMECIGMI